MAFLWFTLSLVGFLLALFGISQIAWWMKFRVPKRYRLEHEAYMAQETAKDLGFPWPGVIDVFEGKGHPNGGPID